MKVAYEAGLFGFWLSDKLLEDNIEAMVVPHSLIPIESGNSVCRDASFKIESKGPFRGSLEDVMMRMDQSALC